ncbi:MAG: M28 family peptidase [Chloroflexota bacterium]
MTDPSSQHKQVSKWLEHVKALSTGIGPRGSTREGERKGAEYARDQFKKIGLTPVWESYQSARSIFLPHLLGSLGMVLAFAIFPLAGKFTAGISAFLSLLVLVSELQELGFQHNLYRIFIPKGESQNVHAVIDPASEHTQDLVLVGHLDTQRTPFIFRSYKHVKAYDNFTTLAFITFFAQALLYSLSVFFTWPWVWAATFPTALCAAVLAAICIEADSTPFTAGANDNATAAGMVLTLAEQFKLTPLLHTRVLAVCTGCEEVQHYGMIDFYKRHRSELKDPKAVVFEMLGCAGPAWLTKEGIVVPFKPDASLSRLVEQLAAEHPEWDAYPSSISGGNTEMADAVRYKVPAITIFGMTRDGVAPYWHQQADTFDKMNPEVMERTWDFVSALIQKIDGLA